jgi:hypothetical protein
MSGGVRLGKAQCGMDRSGEAMVADGSTEGVSLPCCSLRRVDMVSFGGAGPAIAWSGMTWSGVVIAADGSTGAFGLLCCSLSG